MGMDTKGFLFNVSIGAHYALINALLILTKVTIPSHVDALVVWFVLI